MNDLPKKRLMHPYFGEIISNSSKLISNQDYKEEVEFQTFIVNHLTYLHLELVTSKDISYDIYDHFTYKYNLSMYDEKKPLVFPQIAYDTGEFCFIYHYFKTNIASQNKNQSSNLYEKYLERIIERLELINFYSSKEPEKAGKSLKSIIMVLRYMVNKNPIKNAILLRRTVSRLHQFLNYPDPIGSECFS